MEKEPAMTDQKLTQTAEEHAKSKGVTVSGLSQGRANLYRLRPADVSVKEGFNSRTKDFDETDAEDIALAQSIKEVGVKEAVTVFNEEGKVYLSNGHRRRAAALYAIEHLGADPEMTMPAQAEPQTATEAERIFAQIVRNSGKPFTPLEQATVFKKLERLGWSVEDIAVKGGVSTQRIRDLLALDAMPKKVKKMVEKGQVSATLAITTMKKAKGKTDKTAELLTEAVSKAKKEGKTKATQKDVAVAAPNPKARLRAIFSELTFVPLDDNGYSVTLSGDEYAEVRSLIGWA